MKQFLVLLALSIGISTVAARAQDESCSRTSGLCWPRLKRGAHGENVRTLQILLHAKGFSIAPNGRFSAATEQAVRSFQKRKHLKVDGVVGFQTWSEAVPYLSHGTRGEAVRRLQALLSRWNHGKNPVKIDGIYGAQTQQAVRKINVIMSFEETKGSGEADESVWCALLGGHFDGE